ncbi:MAG: ribosome biogenesis factor YjgA [Methylovulum sp.]|nr:ribosome biogenesis factor YjgA [Methylovulum sp.]
MQWFDMIEEYEYGEEDDVEYYAVRPNKTQLKKDIAVLFTLGEKMSELTVMQLNTLDLPENIHKAVIEVAGMPHKSARKRLLKFIAGQINKIDVEPIIEKLARLENKSAHAVREHHIVERWRDRLITDGNNALTALLDEYPEADRQHLRQLLRNAQKEAEAAKPPKSSRLLYRYLKVLFKFEEESEEVIDGLDSGHQ